MRIVQSQPVSKLMKLASQAPKKEVYYVLGFRDDSDRDHLLEAIQTQLGDAEFLVFVIRSGSQGETVADLRVAASVPYLASFLGAVPLSECRSAQEVPEMIHFANSISTMIHVDD